MNPSFHTADIAVITLYFAVLLGIGFFRSKFRRQDETDFILAGRKLTLVPFIASLVATWYGGILGVGEFTYRHGVSNWVVFGLPYYVFALVFAIFLAGRIRADEFPTIPDRFFSRYGRGPSTLSALYVMILASPAPYILSVGVLLELLFGLNRFPALLLATLLSLVYTYHGGFRSIIRTDLLQFLLMFLGFTVIIFISISQLGGPGVLKNLPQLHLTWHGGNTTEYILAWFFIALWTFVDPGFYQRCAAAKSPKLAKRGILLSILFWVLFDFLTLTAGLYARMAAPNLDEPMMALPSLGMNVLPPVLLGLFYVGLLSTIMSTIDSLGFISAITFGRDIMWRWRKGSRDSVRWTQIGLLITACASILLAWLLPSVVDLWYAIGSVTVPGLLIPFLTTFRDGSKVPNMLWRMIIPAGISLAWFLMGTISGETIPHYPFGIEPFYPGLMVSVIWWGLGKTEAD